MQHYRIRTTIVALQQDANRQVAVTIPSGSILKTSEHHNADAAGFVDAEWDGVTVQVFAIDVLERGELIKAMSAVGAAK